MHALGRRLVPAYGLGDGIQYSLIFLALQQRAAELVRIFACRMRELIDKAFAIKRIVGVSDRTPETWRYVQIAHHVFVRKVGYGIRIVTEYTRVDLIDAILHKLRIYSHCN